MGSTTLICGLEQLKNWCKKFSVLVVHYSKITTIQVSFLSSGVATITTDYVIRDEH